MQNNAGKSRDRPPSSSASDALRSLNLNSLSERKNLHRLVTVYKCLNNGIYFDFPFKMNSSYHNYNTRSKNNLHLNNSRKKLWTNFGAARLYSDPSQLERNNVSVQYMFICDGNNIFLIF